MLKRNLNKITALGIYAVLLLLPWHIKYIWQYAYLNEVLYEYGTFSVFGLDILIVILFVLVCLSRGKVLLQVIWREKWWWLLYDMIGFVFLLSALWAIDPAMSLYWWAQYVIGGMLLLILRFGPYKLQFALGAFVFGAVLQSMIAITQFQLQSDLFGANKWLGVSAHDSVEPGVAVVDTGLRRWLRSYAMLPHPNILGGYLAVALLMVISWYLQIDHTLRNLDKQFFKKVKQKLSLQLSGLLVLIIILTLGLLFSFSRSAWLSLVLALITGFILMIRHYKKIGLGIIKSWLKIIVILGVVSGLVVFMYQPLFLTRVQTQQRIEQQSLSERDRLISQANYLIKQNPWGGVGANNFTKAVYEDIDNTQPAYYYQPVHNLYLLIITELGWLGGGLVILMILALMIKMIIAIWNIMYFPLRVFGGVMLVIWISSMFDHYWLTQHFGILLVFTVIGLFLRSYQQYKDAATS